MEPRGTFLDVSFDRNKGLVDEICDFLVTI
jgi:hypothetical protein